MKGPWRLPARLTGGTFLRKLGVLLAGSASARIVSLLAMPILARIYAPHDFGVLALFVSILTIASPLLTLRYNQAIPVARQAKSVLALGVLSFGSTLLLLAMFAPLAALALQLQAIDRIFAPVLPYWPLILLGIVGSVVFETLYFLAIRFELHADLARMQVRRAVLGALTKVGLGLAGLASFGLIAGQIVQQTGGASVIRSRLAPELKRAARGLSPRRLGAIARKYRRFPINLVPSNLTLALSMQAPVLMFSSMYDTRTLGYFAFASTLLAVIVNVVNQSVGVAYFSEITRIQREGGGSIVSITLRLMGAIAVAGLVVTAGAHMLAEPAFALVLGEEWRTAGRYLAPLSMFASLQMATSPMMNLYILKEKQHMMLVVCVMRLAAVAFAWGLLAVRTPPMIEAVWTYAACMILFYGLVAVMILVELGRKSGARRA